MTPPGPDAVALDAPFVHVGRPDFDPDLRYLSGASVARRCALLVDDDPTLFVPPSVDDAGDVAEGVRVERARNVARAAADALADRHDGGCVLAPRSVPHDAALYAESGGFEVASTGAVAEARATKTSEEGAAVERAAGAASAGVKRAATALTRAEADAGATLRVDGDALTAERLRRRVAAAVADAGATPTVTVTCGAERRQGPLGVGETTGVSVLARGPDGYHARVARTFSVGGDGGWERRAQLAAESALRAGRTAAETGADASFVGSELRAELGAYGFESGRLADVGGGVGLAPRERPSLDGDGELPEGATLVLAAGVRSGEGRVALAETIRVTGDGGTRLARLPTSLSPTRY